MMVYITTERLLIGKRYRSFEPGATNYSLMMRMNSVLMNCVSSYFIWSRNRRQYCRLMKTSLMVLLSVLQSKKISCALRLNPAYS